MQVSKWNKLSLKIIHVWICHYIDSNQLASGISRAVLEARYHFSRQYGTLIKCDILDVFWGNIYIWQKAVSFIRIMRIM
jgi:hypothetical protein